MPDAEEQLAQEAHVAAKGDRQSSAAVEGLIRLIARQLSTELDHQNQDKTELPWAAALLAAGLATAAVLMSIPSL